MDSSNPPVAREIDYDATTGIVTADGVPYHLDIWLAAQVGSGRAHNINEARVQMGLPQDPNLPPSPDGAGNPSFTVPSASTAAPAPATASTPAPIAAPLAAAVPAASTPSVTPTHAEHASAWTRAFQGLLHFAEGSGKTVGQLAVVAAGTPEVMNAVPPQVRLAILGVSVAEQLLSHPNAAPASLTQ